MDQREDLLRADPHAFDRPGRDGHLPDDDLGRVRNPDSRAEPGGYGVARDLLARPPADDFFVEVQTEREFQRRRWTDPHDDTHTGLEWGGLLSRYVGRVVDAALTFNRDLYRRSLVALAAVAMAAYEADLRRTQPWARGETDVAP